MNSDTMQASPEKHLFPMFVDLSDKEILVVGGGTIASRRLNTIMAFTSHVTVVAPVVSEAVKASGARILLRGFEPGDLDGVWMVLACTDDSRLNEAICHRAREQGILVNVCSDKTLCDFHFPGVVIHENIVVGINAGGNDHRGAKEARKRIAEIYED